MRKTTVASFCIKDSSCYKCLFIGIFEQMSPSTCPHDKPSVVGRHDVNERMFGVVEIVHKGPESECRHKTRDKFINI